ncbi:MAG: TatD family hydrolase [Candidatus Sericytochromatia bacterium]|nr:TatD family hydrolase [Candidatus Sericytochromatia bacterium]
MERLIDTHCHLDVPQFDSDRNEVLARARMAGVCALIVPGISLGDMPRVLALADSQADIYAGVGVHPHEAASWNTESLDLLRGFLSHPKVVAVGEIGLDYYYPEPAREIQQQAFRAQVQLAADVGLPIIVHDRESHGDILSILQQTLNRRVGGVMHCFSGSGEFAGECVEIGMYISFAGPVTFKNAEKLQRAAGVVPLERLLIETDSPYLAPVPHRGRRNEPAHVLHVAEKLAEIHGISAAEMIRVTRENAERLFSLPPLSQ